MSYLKEKFEEWMIVEKKLSKGSAENYAGAISGSLSKMAKKHSLSNTSLLKASNPQTIALQLTELDEFIEKDKTGNRMYSNALKRFRAFSSMQENIIEDDLSEIISDMPNDEKIALVKARIGQGKFRKNLIKMWGCCAVTKCKEEMLLVASHIKPWRHATSRERLDEYNGLLLIATIDKAFDSGLVSFDDAGNILISKTFKDHEEAGIVKSMKIALLPQHVSYMKHHRENVYKDT